MYIGATTSGDSPFNLVTQVGFKDGWIITYAFNKENLHVSTKHQNSPTFSTKRSDEMHRIIFHTNQESWAIAHHGKRIVLTWLVSSMLLHAGYLPLIG